MTAGTCLRSFLLTFDRSGNVISMVFKDSSLGWHKDVRALKSSAVPHFCYDPLDDGMEYIWLSWQSLERQVMERLIGQRFEETDFLPIPAYFARKGNLPLDKEFPVSWEVMF